MGVRGERVIVQLGLKGGAELDAGTPGTRERGGGRVPVAVDAHPVYRTKVCDLQCHRPPCHVAGVGLAISDVRIAKNRKAIRNTYDALSDTCIARHHEAVAYSGRETSSIGSSVQWGDTIAEYFDV